jgi:RES domain-containing protein
MTRFPRRTLRGDKTLYRIHREVTGGWWFSSDGSGRFDPPPDSGKGACYLAEGPLGAWVEVFRKKMLVSESAVADRVLMSVELGRDLRLADLTSRRALQFEVTASLGANEDYRSSQAFAGRAIAAGFDGIRYFVRHDPGQRLQGIVLFHDAGAVARGSRRWPRGRHDPIPGAVIAEAERLFGYRVLPAP